MGKNSFNNKPTTFLNITSDGMLTQIQKAKNPSEAQMYLDNGFKRVENTNPKTKEISVSYRKSWPSVSGTLTGVTVDKNDIIGQILKLKIEDEEEANIISIPLWTQNGSMSGYASDFIKLCNNIPFDEEIQLGANRKLKNEKGYLVQLLTIQYKERTNDKGMELMARTISKDDLPEVSVVQIGDKKKYDSTKRDAFLYEILTEFMDKLSKYKSTNHNSTSNSYIPKQNTGVNQQHETTGNQSNEPKNPDAQPADNQFGSNNDQNFDDLPF